MKRSTLVTVTKVVHGITFAAKYGPPLVRLMRDEGTRRFGRNLLGFAKDVIIGPVPNPNGRR